MKTEIEAKFLDVDHDAVREKLRQLGAVCEQPMRLMQRVRISNDIMQAKNAYLRVRHEGHRTTITYKQFDELSLTGAKEIEVEVNDYDAAVQLFTAIGLPPLSQMETRRETWRLGEAEVVLDEWPWLKPYIEIEANTEAVVKTTAEKLGFAWDEAAFGDVMTAYRAEYPHLTPQQSIAEVAAVRFEDPLPSLLKVEA